MQLNELIDIYKNRFINRTDVWFKQFITIDGKCGYACQKPDMDQRYGTYESVTQNLIARHFNGEITCAWSAVDKNFCSKWLCFDSDTDDGQLDKFESFLQQYGWHVIREGERPGRDGHLWVLLDGPVQAQFLIWLGDAMMKLANVKDLERFPKYPSHLSQVRGPLGIHRKLGADNCRGWFEEPEQDITEQLKWLAEQPLNSATTAVKLAYQHRPIPKPHIIRHNYSTNNSGKFDFIQYATANGFKQRGNEYISGCPSCKAIGRDTDDNHLSINASNGLVNCWRGCEFINIVRAIKGTLYGAILQQGR